MSKHAYSWRDGLEITLFGAMGTIIGILVSISFKQQWYLGLFVGPLVAGISCGPKEVLHLCKKHWKDAILVIYGISLAVICVSLFAYGFIASTNQLAHLLGLVQSPSEPLRTMIVNAVISGVAFVTWWFYIDRDPITDTGMAVSCRGDLFPLAKISGALARFVLKKKLLCMKPPTTLFQYARQLFTCPIRWMIRGVIVAWFGVIMLPLQACIIACDVPLTIMLQLATTKRLACMTNAAIGTLTGYLYASSHAPDQLPLALAIGILVGCPFGLALYHLRKVCATSLMEHLA